jgi:hypothetical protein
METIDSLNTLANDVAGARTMDDLAALRSQLQNTKGILTDERDALRSAIVSREQEIIRLYLPRLQ